MSEEKVQYSSWCQPTQFDPTLFEKLKADFGSGYKIYTKILNKDARLETVELTTVTTIEDLESFIYDYFYEKCYCHIDNFILGLNKSRANPYKPAAIYYDGLIYSETRDEFIDSIKYYTVDRLFSFICHYYRHPWLEFKNL